MSTETVDIADIIVGERARKDYGDLTGLMESIREHGLLQPIGLAPGNHLLFGGRRLEAIRRLGLSRIEVVRPTTQTDALSLLRAERDENTCRKDMTAEELVDLGLRLEELERPKAEARKADGQRRGSEVRWKQDASGPTGPEASEKPETNRTAQVVGDALGVSRNAYKRMKHVVMTARNDELPPEVQAVARQALDDLNVGKVAISSAYKKVRQARESTHRDKDVRAHDDNDQQIDQLQPTPPGYRHRRKHLQVVRSMTAALDGLVIAADGITELDSSITKEEAAQLTRDLSRQIRSLNRLNNLLKEHIS